MQTGEGRGRDVKGNRTKKHVPRHPYLGIMTLIHQQSSTLLENVHWPTWTPIISIQRMLQLACAPELSDQGLHFLHEASIAS